MLTKRSSVIGGNDPDVLSNLPEPESPTRDAELFSGSFDLDPDVICERLDGRLILVHLRSNRIYELSSTASYFCELLISGRSPAACLEILAQEFDASQEVLCAEMQYLLETLSQQEIVRRPL